MDLSEQNGFGLLAAEREPVATYTYFDGITERGETNKFYLCPSG